MKLVCCICGRALRGVEGAIGSRHTGQWFCPIDDWDACRERADAIYEAMRKKATA